MKQCPCHSGKAYEACCAPYHQGEAPPDALALMRSRYSAYALNNADYILATTHPDHPDFALPAAVKKEQIQAFSKNTQFKGLKILEHVAAQPYSTVTFQAILVQKGRDATYTEKSEFAQIDGRWLYRRALTIT